MKKDLQTTIQAYLSGQLRDEELQAFEARLKAEPGLAREVKDLQSIELGLESLGAEIFQEDLKDWEEKHQKRSRAGRMSPMRILAIAAALVVPIGAFIIFQLNAPTSSSDLFASHFEPYGNFQTVRDDANASAFTKGMRAYDEQNYEAAIAQFQMHLAENKDDACTFYLGVSLISNQDYDKGADILKELFSHPLYGEAAMWYAFLAHLKVEHISEARNLGEQILENDGHYKFDEVRGILKSLPE